MKKIFKLLIGAKVVLLVSLLASCYYTNSGFISTNYGKYDDADSYSTGDFTFQENEVKKVTINWIAGEIKLSCVDKEIYSISEDTKELPEEEKLHYYLSNGVLKIQYCKSEYKNQIDSKNKNITVEIPKNIDVEFNVISSTVKSEEFVAKTLKFNSTSGSFIALSTNCEKVKGNLVSGSISLGDFTGNSIKFVSTSGDLFVDVKSLSSIDFNAVSGDLNATLNGLGATIDFDTISGDFTCEPEYQKINGNYIIGDGAIEITSDSTSGSIKIK